MIRIIRSIVKSIADGVYRTFEADGRSDEEVNGRFIQHYGFRSQPLPGTDMVVLQQGNNYISIAENTRAEDDPTTRMSDGDVTVYATYPDQQPTVIILKPQINTIYIVSNEIGWFTTVNGDESAVEYLITSAFKKMFDEHTHNCPVGTAGGQSSTPVQAAPNTTPIKSPAVPGTMGLGGVAISDNEMTKDRS